MPIPVVRADQQAKLVELVNSILAAKRNNPEADTTKLESQIDRLVYKLYELTEAEIAKVERRHKCG